MPLVPALGVSQRIEPSVYFHLFEACRFVTAILSGEGREVDAKPEESLRSHAVTWRD